MRGNAGCDDRSAGAAEIEADVRAEKRLLAKAIALIVAIAALATLRWWGLR